MVLNVSKLELSQLDPPVDCRRIILPESWSCMVSLYHCSIHRQPSAYVHSPLLTGVTHVFTAKTNELPTGKQELEWTRTHRAQLYIVWLDTATLWPIATLPINIHCDEWSIQRMIKQQMDEQPFSLSTTPSLSNDTDEWAGRTWNISKDSSHSLLFG